jgi:hypothetical protein
MREDTRIVGQVYPWDIADDPGRPHTLLAAGIREVAIAASYHAVRTTNWVNGTIPKVVHQGTSAYYLPVDDLAWADSPLRPTAPGALAAGSFARSLRRATAEGLVARAWLVLAHDDANLAVEHPELATVDAWGSRSSYGLCISQPEVAKYSRRLVEQTVVTSGIRQLLVESVTAPGFDHPVAHDKAENSGLSVAERLLLSLCFCDACVRRSSEDGWDGLELASDVRESFSSGRISDATALMVSQYLSTRASTALSLCEALAEPIGGAPIEITIAATTATQSFSSYVSLQSTPSGVTGLCAQLAGHAGQGLTDLARWRNIPGLVRAATVNLGPLGSTLAEALAELNATEIAELADEIYLYHVGLRRPDTLRNLDISNAAPVLTGEK